MSKHGRDRRPYIKPVTRLELSEANIKYRWIAIAVLLAVAVVAIGYGVHLALSVEPGWQEVTATADEVNCARDFTLMYDFSAGDINPTVAHKKLQLLYTSLTESAYRFFSAEAEGTDNLYALNANINTVVILDPVVYHALERIADAGLRHPFMAPVQSLYASVFLSAGDAEASHFDPMQSPELMLLVKQTAAYTNDPEMISLELLGDCKARLNVAEDYLSFARDCGIETFLDLGWMKNAFIADYIAEALEAEGFCYGYLASYDGFTRNLDIRGTDYTTAIFDRQGTDILMPANFHYSGRQSIVSLRDYPLSDQDQWNYYVYDSGEITTVFLDPEDGVSKSAPDTLVSYSEKLGCSEILLKTAGIFTAETLDREALMELSRQEVHSIWFEENALLYTQKDAQLQIMTETGGAGYALRFAEE